MNESDLGRFEAHITTIAEDMGKADAVIPAGWKNKSITGDPLLGPGARGYFTAYDTSGSRLKNSMLNAVAILESHGITILRTKIERIVYDSRTGISEL